MIHVSETFVNKGAQGGNCSVLQAAGLDGFTGPEPCQRLVTMVMEYLLTQGCWSLSAQLLVFAGASI